jgi:hypothetical protein
MTWTARSVAASADTDVFHVHDDRDRPLTRADALALLRESAPFRTFLVRVLAEHRFVAFFWETPAATLATQDRAFEFVLVDAPSLARIAPDPSDFEVKFDASPDADVLVFPNLGGDAILVVPAPRADQACYAHLASFVRGAPASQIDTLLAELARAVQARLSPAPLWVSTAGMGVSWLHVRLDSRPKYYRHDPYRRA